MPIPDARLKRLGLDLIKTRLSPSGLESGPGLRLRSEAEDPLASWDQEARVRPGVDSTDMRPGGTYCQYRQPGKGHPAQAFPTLLAIPCFGEGDLEFPFSGL